MKQPKRDWPFRWDSQQGAWDIETATGRILITEHFAQAHGLSSRELMQRAAEWCTDAQRV